MVVISTIYPNNFGHFFLLPNFIQSNICFSCIVLYCISCWFTLLHIFVKIFYSDWTCSCFSIREHCKHHLFFCFLSKCMSPFAEHWKLYIRISSSTLLFPIMTTTRYLICKAILRAHTCMLSVFATKHVQHIIFIASIQTQHSKSNLDLDSSKV